MHIKSKENKFSSLTHDINDVNNRKVMSSIICEQPCGDDLLYDRLVKDWIKPERNRSNPFITIVGQTQIGKTFILKKLLRNYVNQSKAKNDSQNIKQYKYVFYISLEYVNCSDRVNFLQFLTMKTAGLSRIDWKCKDPSKEYIDQKLYKKVVERITSKEEDAVCIILDHFEKSNFSHKEYPRSDTHCSYSEEATAGYFISRLLRHGFENGQLLTLLNPWHFFLSKATKCSYPSSYQYDRCLG